MKLWKNRAKLAKKLGMNAKPREMGDIQKEYSQLCARVGDLYYKWSVMKVETGNIEDSLDSFVSKMRDLNVEGQKSKANETKEGAQDESSQAS